MTDAHRMLTRLKVSKHLGGLVFSASHVIIPVFVSNMSKLLYCEHHSGTQLDKQYKHQSGTQSEQALQAQF